ncbi:MAG: hypothetical protein A2033_19330 [Bacteroidetes bacterium GWA2_31_9]|nr:MAG: hypothetical protein A2033_19330 [Bacteroidetes bacterium GWA2_31_9]
MIDRLRKIIEVNNYTPSIFADEIGVQRSSISHILSERNKPSLELVQKLLTRFRDLNPEWLLFGIGKMTKDNKVLTSSTELNFEKDVNLIPSDKIPKVEIENIIKSHSSNSEIEKIMIFYTDKTFEIFNPK